RHLPTRRRRPTPPPRPTSRSTSCTRRGRGVCCRLSERGRSPLRRSSTKNLAVVREALYDVRGRRLAVVTATADEVEADESPDEAPIGEQGLISLLVSDLDA